MKDHDRNISIISSLPTVCWRPNLIWLHIFLTFSLNFSAYYEIFHYQTVKDSTFPLLDWWKTRWERIPSDPWTDVRQDHHVHFKHYTLLSCDVIKLCFVTFNCYASSVFPLLTHRLCIRHTRTPQWCFLSIFIVFILHPESTRVLSYLELLFVLGFKRATRDLPRELSVLIFEWWHRNKDGGR